MAKKQTQTEAKRKLHLQSRAKYIGNLLGSTENIDLK